MLEISTQIVGIPHPEITIDAYLAIPVTSQPVAAVIVLQEIFGVNEHIQDVTRRIAQEGYVAIAPAMYQRQAPGFTVGYTPEDIQIGRKYKNQTTAGEILSDIQATIDFLYTLPQVKRLGVGCIGFCFGGHMAYLAATLAEVKATASFYGAGIATWTPGGGEPTINLTPQISGTIYTFFGVEDASIPVEEVKQIEATLQSYHIPHKVFRYEGAEHGFFCNKRGSYHDAAATDAWEKVLQLFAQLL